MYVLNEFSMAGVDASFPDVGGQQPERLDEEGRHPTSERSSSIEEKLTYVHFLLIFQITSLYHPFLKSSKVFFNFETSIVPHSTIVPTFIILQQKTHLSKGVKDTIQNFPTFKISNLRF